MNLRKNTSALVIAAATAALAGTFGFAPSQLRAAAPPAPVFDWSVTDTTGNPNFTPAPFLTDASAQSIHDTFVAEYMANPNTLFAVKVTSPISNASAHLVFGGPGMPVPYSVKYVFADLESGSGSTDVTNTAALVAQIKGSGSNSSGAFIGEFGLLAPPVGSNPIDSTRVGGSVGTAQSFTGVFGSTSYTGAKVNVSAPAAYPGSPDFLSKSQSGAPDIRSALFVLPIDRVTFATDGATGNKYNNGEPGTGPAISPGNYQNIPWISRFNNWGNTVLDNTPGAQNYKYAFTTTNQLLSANDFSAQVLQYRLRGATSFNLFNYTGVNAGPNANSTYSSVIGYTADQEQSDALKGWNYDTNGDGSANMVLNGILSRTYAFANLTNKVPGTGALGAKRPIAIEAISSGMMLSGVYDKTNAGGAKMMVLLLSNMTESTQKVYFSQKFGGASIDLIPGDGKVKGDGLETIAPGSHELLTFTLNTGANAWVLTNGGPGTGGIYGQSVFQSLDANGDRNGIGVPEPASIGLLGLGGLGLLARRRRTA